MKPHIKWEPLYQCWLCIDNNTFTYAGGTTPEEAYLNWKEHVNQVTL